MRKIQLLIIGLLFTTLGFSQENSGSFSLQQAIDYAIENNRAAKNALLDIDAAKKQKWETTAIGLPQINAKIDYQNWLKQQVSLLPAAAFDNTQSVIDVVNDYFDTNQTNFDVATPEGFIPLRFGTKQSMSATATLSQLLFFKPDLIYLAPTAKGIGLYKDLVVVVLIKLFKVNLVLHFHNKGVSINQNRIIDDFFYRLLFKKTKVILLSKYLYLDIKKYVSEQEIFYCPNGIPSLNFNNSNKRIDKKTINLLFLSNIIKSKGVFVLLEALKKIKEKGGDFVCNFVGGIGDINEIEFDNKVSSLKLEGYVNFLGSKYKEEKNKIFLNSDIFVHPTLEDCFPLVLIEASQFSLPLVSTYEGGIPDIIEDEVTGFLVSKNNVNSLAEKLNNLIESKELRKQLGRAARIKYENEFTLEKFEQKLSEILAQLV